MKFLTICLLALFLHFVMMEKESTAALYQWQDSTGGLHFTDNPESIPPAYRNRSKISDSNEQDAAPVSDAVRPPEMQQGEPSPLSSTPEKGRGYWQMRYSSLRTELKGLKDGLGSKKEEMNSHRRKWLVTQKRVERQNINRIEGEISNDEERIQKLEKQLEALDLEAARNAVPLEWRN